MQASDVPRPAVRLDDLIDGIVRVRSGVLDQLAEAVLAADHLGDVADHLIGHFVDQARRSGASWSDIGKSMGVSKQAAQQRSVPKDHLESATIPFTTRAWSVLTGAQHAAREAASGSITPVHVTIGLAAEPNSVALLVLADLGVTADMIRETAVAFLPEPSEGSAELIPYSPDGRKALELAYRAALRMGHNYVGTEHLLLGLIEFEAGTGVLASLEVDEVRVRDLVNAVLGISTPSV
jgi:Clp amino terminal domain, pathogenicity island component